MSRHQRGDLMATCAACRHEIAYGERVSIIDTEVVHRDCAQHFAAGLPPTLRWELQRRLDAALADAAQLRVDNARLRSEAAYRELDMARERGATESARKERDRAIERSVETERRTSTLLNVKEQENARLRSDLDTARSENATMRKTEAAESEAVDATIQRFRMLELD